MRRRVGLASIAAGIILAAIAAVAFFGNPAEVGETEAVERSLTSISTTTPTTLETATTEPEPLVPLWQESINISHGDPARRIPTLLTIDQIGVSADIEPYGVNERTREMDVPPNVEDVGWYEHGPSPGHAGSAVLAAHVDLTGQGPGVFFDLKELDPGDFIEVGFEDGSRQGFVVEARTTYLKTELPLEAIFSRMGPPVLTLITCGGGFDSSESSYDSNVVVYAIPVGENNREDSPGPTNIN